MSDSKTVRSVAKVSRANVVLGAIGLVGIGAMIGGMAGEQPGRSGNRATGGQPVGIAADGQRLYRLNTNGSVDYLDTRAALGEDGTTAEWRVFKSAR